MTADISSVRDCNQLCVDTAGCVAFVLSPVTRACSLKDDSHGDISYDTGIAVKGGIAGLVNCRSRKDGEENGNSIAGFDRKFCV